MAKNLIRDLLRKIGSDYSETRASVSSLYKLSVEQQAEEVKANLRDRLFAKESKDSLGVASSTASFFENFLFLKELDSDLYGTMKDSLRFARSSNLIDSESNNDIMKLLNDTHNDVMKRYINNASILEVGGNSTLESLLGVTNASRAGRGNLQNTLSNTVERVNAIRNGSLGGRTGRGN